VASFLASCQTTNLLSKKDTQPSSVAMQDSSFLYNPAYQYYIRKDDKISISVWGQDELSVGSVYGIYNSNEVYGKWLLVDAEGRIEAPKLGTLNVQGLTVPQLKDTLKRRYSQWVLNPIVDIKVLNKEITVLGEVRNPQVIQVDKDVNLLLELISKTGGFDFYANLKAVKVLRQEGPNVRVVNVDLSQSGDLANRNIQLHPGDVVVVPSRKHKEFDKRISTIVPFTTTVTAAAVLFGLF
jgi:polysaccharide export outer membrane protein